MRKMTKKLNQDGFIPMMIALIAVIIAVIVFAYLRVAKQ